MSATRRHEPIPLIIECWQCGHRMASEEVLREAQRLTRQRDRALNPGQHAARMREWRAKQKQQAAPSSRKGGEGQCQSPSSTPRPSAT